MEGQFLFYFPAVLTKENFAPKSEVDLIIHDVDLIYGYANFGLLLLLNYLTMSVYVVKTNHE